MSSFDHDPDVRDWSAKDVRDTVRVYREDGAWRWERVSVGAVHAALGLPTDWIDDHATGLMIVIGIASIVVLAVAAEFFGLTGSRGRRHRR